MKEEKFKKDSFIGGWYIDKNICNELIDIFENNSNLHHPGKIGKDLDSRISKEEKDSTDIGVNVSDPLMQPYNKELNKVLHQYIKKYPESNNLYSRYSIWNIVNIQRYYKNQGFKKWHCERTDKDSMNRVLVFMTYLNTVKKGGTEFLYQKIKTEAKQGLTLIWPPDFTHTHRGIVCEETKYIVTGWFTYV